MTMTRNLVAAAAALVAIAGSGAVARADAPWLVPVQGYLTDDAGTPVDGDQAIGVALYTTASGGTAIYAETQTVTVDNGYFTVYVGDLTTLDLATFRDQGDLWLGLTVGLDPEMTPRLSLGSVPYAGFAQYCADASAVDWAGVTGVPSDLVDGDSDTTYTSGAGLTLVGTEFSADTSYLQRRVTDSCGAGSSIQVINVDGTVTCELDDDTTYTNGTGLLLIGNAFSANTSYLQRRVSSCGAGSAIRVVNADGTVVCETDDVGLTGWLLGGNAGTTPGTDYVGTSDNQALELAVNGARAMRLEPASDPNIIGGHAGNNVTAGVLGGTIGGGGTSSFVNSVTDTYATVGGGSGNQAGDAAGTTDDARWATVSGGNRNTAGSGFATVAGGVLNVAGNQYATVSGGYQNNATGADATVGGGGQNAASGNFATVGGGGLNTAGGGSSTVAGGNSNTASGHQSVVAGGNNNTSGGLYSAVVGGRDNTAAGNYATVAGGWQSSAAGLYSFAAGRRAKADADGCFVWGDSTDADVTCAANQWVARASGGFYLYSTSGVGVGVYLAAGSGAWASISDRNAKRDITPVDAGDVLARLAAMPVATWRYETEQSGAIHMGPMAQDFYAAFGLGDSDRHITTVDADGVALAAIKGLDGKLDTETRALRDEIRALREDNRALRRHIAELDAHSEDLEARLSALERGARSGKLTRADTAPWPNWLVGSGLGLSVLVLALFLRRHGSSSQPIGSDW